MSTEEILTMLSLIATVIIGIAGFGFTIYQIYKSNKVKKAEFVSSLLKHLRLNERIIEANYIIDYSEHWYNEHFHNSGELEKNIDALFSQIDFICYLYSNSLLSKADFSIFKYEISRICNNSQCRCYLWNLYHWAKANGVQCSFDNLINYLKKNLSEKELAAFESNKKRTSGYEQYLNF